MDKEVTTVSEYLAPTSSQGEGVAAGGREGSRTGFGIGIIYSPFIIECGEITGRVTRHVIH
jgi:hypothetical protein